MLLALLIVQVGFTMAQNGWTQLETTNAPKARGYHSAVITKDNKMLVFAGSDGEITHNPLADHYVLDLNTKEWSELKGLNYNTQNRMRHTAVHSDGKTVIFGGAHKNHEVDSISLTNNVWVYSDASNSWHFPEAESGPKPRDLHSTVISGGKMYVFGGVGQGTFWSDLWEYNIDSHQWKQLASLAKGYANGAAAATEDKIYFFGGRNYYGGGGVVKTLLAYDIKENKWDTLPTTGTPSSRVGASALVIGNNFYIFGGSDLNGKFLNELWSLDLKSLAWTKLAGGAGGPAPRDRQTAVVWENNKIVVFGGYDGFPPSGKGFYNDVWVYTL